MDTLPRVIALSGHRGSGKDTVGSHLAREYGYIPVSFAAPLKDMVSRIYNVPREYMDDRDKKEMPLYNMPVIPSDAFTTAVHGLLSDELRHGFWTPRALCILEGSVKRSVNSSYWVRSVAERILYSPDERFVITDMRYKSEADLLRIMINGIELIRIERKGLVLTTQDPSERDLDDYKFDGTISNSSTIPELQRIVDLYLQQ